MAFRRVSGIIGAVRKFVEVISIKAQQATQTAVDVWGQTKGAIRETTVETFRKVEGVTQVTVRRVGEYASDRGWIEEYVAPSPFLPVEERLWSIAEAVGEQTGADLIEFWEKSQDIRALGRDQVVPLRLYSTTADKLNTYYRGVFWMVYRHPETEEWMERMVYSGVNQRMTVGDMESLLKEKFAIGKYPEIGYIESIDLIGMEVM